MKQFPGHPQILHLLGLAQQDLGDLRGAMTLLSQAVAREPTNATFILALGIVLKELGHSRAALERFRDAAHQQPTNPDSCFHLGDAHMDLGEAAAAIEPFRTAIRLRPGFKEAWINLGLCLKACGALSEALLCFQEVVRQHPDSIEGHLNLGLTQLLMGDYDNGWQEYEWRLRFEGEAACIQMPDLLHTPQPPRRWEGSSLAGKTLLVVGEQGFGDTLQFVRYLPGLKAAGARILLTSPRPLIPLLRTMAAIDHLSTPQTVTAVGPIDYYCPLLSLPLALQTRWDTIPSQVPYLQADPALAAHWKQRLGNDQTFRVGLVWQGKPLHQNDPLRRRSCPPKAWAPLGSVAGVTWVSLQKREATADPLPLPAGMAWIDLNPALTDFGQTAAILTTLDLLISIDTSVAHLAGALGKPVWILLPFAPDWRWSLDPDRTPWYPTARLFRQTTPNCWQDPIHRIVEALPLFMHGHKETP